MREPPKIAAERLLVCLRDQYGVEAATLEFLPLGLDTRAGVFRVVDERGGGAYLLKVKWGPLYEPTLWVPRYLRDQGIEEVVAPIATLGGGLWTPIGAIEDGAEWAAMLYPFIEGERGWTPPVSDAQWEAVGATLRRIHEVAPPTEDMPELRQESFDPGEYGRSVQVFDERFAHMTGTGNEGPLTLAFRERWIEHRSTILEIPAAMATLAVALRQRSGPLVICHADLHPSNMIRDDAGRVFVIDWDDVMLAPKERDFLFVGEPPADGPSEGSIPPFFKGYGPAEIDWVAVTYYRCERLITDVIEFAREVVDREDLGPDYKREAVGHFGDLFAPANNAERVWTAAAHLPAGMREQVRGSA